MKRMANYGFQISDFNSSCRRRLTAQAATGCQPVLRRGFTIVELLVVVGIIGLLAGFVLAALAKTREAARAAATKATIAKLNDLVMRKYESYATRRLPFDVSALNLSPKNYATLRMQALRDLMRMEMPERWCDITSAGTATVPPVPPAGPTGSMDKAVWLSSSGTAQPPALQNIYLAKLNQALTLASGMSPPPNIFTSDHQQAKCLYLWVMTAIPEAKSTFSGSEIGINYDGDGLNVFIDGWGNPIGFLRWAPGATVTLTAAGGPVTSGAIPGSGWSDIQINDTAGANLHHDPFDPNFVAPGAYHLYPLIFAGVLNKINGFDDYGIVLGNQSVTGDARDISITAPTADPFSGLYAGSSTSSPVGAIEQANGGLPMGGVPLFHNHHMEQK